MRLLTRSDFDGLMCAMLLREKGIIDQYKFVHPKDVQDGKIEVTENDVLANVPYVPGCGLWFDHHFSEGQRAIHPEKFVGSYKESPSCARVIWEYYGGHKTFQPRFDELMAAVDKSDSAQFTADDIENPQGWVLLSFVMDPRTGLGRYRDYRISNYQLMEEMVEWCRTHTIEQILDQPDVQERVRRYNEQNTLFREMLSRTSSQHGNAIVVDLRNEEQIYSGNRFMVYTMFPTANISIQVLWGLRKQNVVFTCGHSIINRTSKTNVGSLMLQYGGGGHRGVGTCQVPEEEAQDTLKNLIARINVDG